MLPIAPQPDVSEQIRIIQEHLQRNKITPETDGYLIYKKWLDLWKESVGFNGPATFAKVGLIDNKPLFNDTQLKDNIQMHKDFEVVPEVVYHTLHDWYGGGPEIKKKVEHDPIHNANVVVIQTPSFEVYYKEFHHTFDFSLYKPIRFLKLEICEYFKVSEVQAHLFDFFGKVALTELDDEKCLAYYAIPSHSMLLLTEQTEEGAALEYLANKTQEFWTSLDRSEGGMHGLIGFKNGCYLNTVLQCLLHTAPITDYFSEGKWMMHFNQSNPRGTQGRLAEAFAGLMRDMWKRQVPVLSPRFFKGILGDKVPSFVGEDQQDAHEVITFALDLIHEDLNSGTPVEYSMNPIEGTPENEVLTAQNTWERYRQSNDSFIVDTFHGLFRSQIKCSKCNHVKVEFDPYSSISLPIPLPYEKTVPFIFIPWNLKEPRIKMQLELNNPTLLLEVTAGICSKMHREMQIIYAEHRKDSIELRWLNELPRAVSDIKVVAFEIPAHARDAIFAQVRLLAPVKKTNRKTNDEIDSFYLVELPSAVLETKLNKTLIQEACVERFAPLFTPTLNEVHNSKIKDIMEKLYKPDSPSEEFTEQLRAEAKRNSFERDQNVTFERDRVVPIVTNRIIKVIINPEIACDPSKFDWSSLRQLINTVDKGADTYIPSFFSLGECLELFAAESSENSETQHICPFCHEMASITQKMDIWSAPKVLILHLKRYRYNKYLQKKLTENVNYPEVLDLSPFVVGDQVKSSLKYRLYAVIDHLGSLNEGHYETSIYHPSKDKYYKFNDQSVQAIKRSKAHSQDAYVLFYQKIEG